MQNKGLIRFFAIIFGLVCLYQLSFTYFTNQTEDEAKAYAVAQAPADADAQDRIERAYLDSIGANPIFAGITYNDAKEKELNKGLDLKGGINVILQISIRDILGGLSNNSTDPAFIAALDATDELQKDSQNTYFEDFVSEFENQGGELASPDIFANVILNDKVDTGMTNAEVAAILEAEIKETIGSAFETLRNRIDKFGVTQPNIQRLGTSGRILVELPGVKDKKRATELITTTAQLEFWDAYKAEEFGSFLNQANEALKLTVNVAPVTEEIESQDSEDSKIDDLLGEASTDSTAAGNASLGPLYDLVRAPGQPGQPVLAMFDVKDKQTVLEYLNRPEVRGLLAADQRYVKFSWGIQAEGSELVELYALKGNREKTPELSGAVITDARQAYSPNGQPTVSMTMNSKGSKIWETMTGRAFTTGGQIAIVLDNIVYSAPGVTTGPIAGGNSEISGSFTLNEAVDLANVLRAGKLPASAEIVEAEIVGPSLGQEAIDSGMKSFLIALTLVLIWMLFYYGKAGIASDIALMLNILLMFGVLSGLGAVLTLPGIA